MHRLLPSADRPLDARITAPASKSETHRALVAAALADGESAIVRPLDAEDTRATLYGLQSLGVPVSVAQDRWSIVGRRGGIAGGGRLELGESGTSLRLLAATAAIGEAASRIDGAARLRERPLTELIGALRALGAGVEGAALPLEIGGKPLTGGDVAIDASRSSQFVSAMMLIGPCLASGLTIRTGPEAVSLPYVELTRSVMRAFGVKADRDGPLSWRVPEATYRATTFCVDGDHSSASYFLAAPLVAGGRVRVERLDPASAQPDACFRGVLEQLGASVRTGEDWIEVCSDGNVAGFDLSLGHAPDLAPTVAALGFFSDGPAVIRDVGHLRHKESDRLEQLAANMRRLGRSVEIDGDRLEIGSSIGEPRESTVATAGDHRIAMAFALVGLGVAGLRVDDAGCVDKSNPRFWQDWESLID